MSDPKHAFASYVREDYHTVERLASTLTASGVKVWLDRNEIEPGSRWKRVIKRAIHDGSYFLACFSRNYTQRTVSYMNEELTLAVELLRQKPTDRPWFIPILLDDCEVPEREIGGGETLRDLQYVTLFDDWDDGIQRILNVIKPAKPDLPEERTADTVLFLASNPRDTSPLQLDAELREVQGAILSSGLRDRIRLEIRLAVTLSDLARGLLEVRPTILHLSGHGSSESLVLENEYGLSAKVGAETVFHILLPFSEHLKCVVLNSSDSQSLAKELVKRIEFVIGMPPRLTDAAAIAFSAGFYQAIGNGRSIPESFELGRSMIFLEGFDEDTMPILFSRP